MILPMMFFILVTNIKYYVTTIWHLGNVNSNLLRLITDDIFLIYLNISKKLVSETVSHFLMVTTKVEYLVKRFNWTFEIK